MSAAIVSEAHARAVHAKRHGFPASVHAVPGMSAQPEVANALERMTDIQWANFTGTFVAKRVYSTYHTGRS